MIARKPDADAIREFLEELAAKPWLGLARKQWPRHLFRFDDVEAAAAILTSGRLLSRASAEKEGVMLRDCALQSVITHTPEQYKGYARLYFRPRTPTQYHMEGLKSGCAADEPHCPIPVFLVFDAAEVLTRETTKFSNGNLGKNGVKIGGDATFLRRLPFEVIYHNDWFDKWDQSRRDEIIFHRHAEAMVPGELDLAGLKYIGCRSDAEYATLLSLLDEPTRKRWQSSIGTKGQLHERTRAFVQRVDIADGKVVLRFNRSSKDEGRFRIRLEVREGGAAASWEEPSYVIVERQNVRVPQLPGKEPWTVRLTLDGCLAYQGIHRFETDPS